MKYSFLIILLALTLGFSGCSTGIDSTKRIEMSREDKKLLVPSAEEVYMEDVLLRKIGEIALGERFKVTADSAQAGALFYPELPAGAKNVVYRGYRQRTAPDGTETVIFLFSTDMTDTPSEYLNTTSKDNLERLTSDFFIGLLDEKTLSDFDRKLRGKDLWTRSVNRESPESDGLQPGRKFHKIRVDSVTSGDFGHPLRVWWTDDDSKRYYLPMGITNKTSESRRFSTLFYLSNPRVKYPQVSDEMWEYICKASLCEGMTKEEVKLAIGNPSEVRSGHDYQKTLDIWAFPSGQVVRFEDGLLVNFRDLCLPPYLKETKN